VRCLESDRADRDSDMRPEHAGQSDDYPRSSSMSQRKRTWAHMITGAAIAAAVLAVPTAALAATDSPPGPNVGAADYPPGPTVGAADYPPGPSVAESPPGPGVTV